MRAAGWEQHIDDGSGDIARLTDARTQMHPEARRCVNFNNPGVTRDKRLLQGGCYDIDSHDIESHQPGDSLRHPLIVGVHQISDIYSSSAGTDVGCGFDIKFLTAGQNALKCQTLGCEQALGRFIADYPCQVFFMPFAPLGVLVDLMDELADGIHSVADDKGGFAEGGCRKPVVDDQDAEVKAFDELLYDTSIADAPGQFVRREKILGISDIYCNPSAMVTDQRLDHHRITYALGRCQGFFKGVHRSAFRDRDAIGLQYPLRPFLIIGNFDAQSGGSIHHGSLNPALMTAVPELDIAVFIQAKVGDAPASRFFNYGSGGRTKAGFLCNRL
ncbi:hypothetical protein DSECCO2_662040 [anaerobic digester metagenome]